MIHDEDSVEEFFDVRLPFPDPFLLRSRELTLLFLLYFYREKTAGTNLLAYDSSNVSSEPSSFSSGSTAFLSLPAKPTRSSQRLRRTRPSRLMEESSPGGRERKQQSRERREEGHPRRSRFPRRRNRRRSRSRSRCLRWVSRRGS